jgi:hypothetical protein
MACPIESHDVLIGAGVLVLKAQRSWGLQHENSHVESGTDKATQAINTRVVRVGSHNVKDSRGISAT